VNAFQASKRAVAASDALGVAMLTQIRDELDLGTLCVVPVQTPWMLRAQEAELQRRFDRLDPAGPSSRH
jgi:hypothetical protein